MIFITLPTPCSRTKTQEFTQPLTEMRNAEKLFLWSRARLVLENDSFSATRELIV
jgi:hypothetical protein